MNRLNILLLILSISLLGYSQTAKEYFERGLSKGFNEYRSKEKYREAIADFSKAIEIKPTYAEAYYYRGYAKGVLFDYRGAISDMDKAIEFKPNYADAYSCRGRHKNYLEDFKGAIADYTKCIELSPDDKGIYYARGTSKFWLKDYRGAISDYSKDIELEPHDYDANTYASRGVAKLKLGLKDSGCLDFSKAGELGDEKAYDLIVDLCN